MLILLNTPLANSIITVLTAQITTNKMHLENIGSSFRAISSPMNCSKKLRMPKPM